MTSCHSKSQRTFLEGGSDVLDGRLLWLVPSSGNSEHVLDEGGGSGWVIEALFSINSLVRVLLVGVGTIFSGKVEVPLHPAASSAASASAVETLLLGEAHGRSEVSRVLGGLDGLDALKGRGSGEARAGTTASLVLDWGHVVGPGDVGFGEGLAARSLASVSEVFDGRVGMGWEVAWETEILLFLVASHIRELIDCECGPSASSLVHLINLSPVGLPVLCAHLQLISGGVVFVVH